MDWRNWNLPMDAGRGDAIIGTTEDGRPIYRSQLGTQYWQTPRAPKPKPDVASLLPAYGGQYETSKTAPAWAGSQPGLGDLGGVLGGVLGAVMSGVSAPGRALRGQPVTKGDVINTALDWGLLSAPMSAPRGALRAGGMADDAPKGIRAYHGSPHDFDQFDMSKIGTGEGAQAYGHGLYFAENEAVARGYRDALAASNSPATTVARVNGREVPWYDLSRDEQMLLAHLLDNGNDYAKADATLSDVFLPQAVDRRRAVLKSMQERGFQAGKPGRMYEVQINANPDDFLDWDRPLSEQPHIANRLGVDPNAHSRLAAEIRARVAEDMRLDGRSVPDEIDQRNLDLATEYETLSSTGDAASYAPRSMQMIDEMKAKGIPGIKYLDQGSRAAGDGSRNYVVFDDKLITILRKYGLLPALLGGSGIFNQQQPQG